jgi:hypothetical protein
MIQFPQNLIPNYIAILQLPEQLNKMLIPTNDFNIQQIRMAGSKSPIRMTMQFRSRSVDINIEATCHTDEKAGWQVAKAFHELVGGSLREFEIGDSHPAWDNATLKFNDYTWRITDINQSGNFVGDFDITIESVRQLPRVTVNVQRDLPSAVGEALVESELQYSNYDGGVVDAIAGISAAFIPQIDAIGEVTLYDDIEAVELKADNATEETTIVTTKGETAEYQPAPDNQVVAGISTYDNTFDQYTYSRPTWFDIKN